ncbi:hypothetical protein BCV69DRAFT_166846 [Microstroma glucosiphilum]|uniref:mRNA cap guanine-N(7) methyltransferase n=1 Tax=Pseudomicrostroma glucosiphilum TaxID=1684307 RepID=A0A316UA75_9BASI|nr:hypothetical protein BCV69DRAFT_166846 [Pseudomicrostroma glucosiphilum]PWN21313.1 hypothetical protein BCV69DRAFT_166846 [Pseudomicrostroma glucosiphilum]
MVFLAPRPPQTCSRDRRSTTQESVVSHKRPKSSGRFSDDLAGISDARYAPTASETVEAEAATRDVEERDAKALGSGIATELSMTGERAPAVKKAKSLISVKSDQGSNGHPAHTPSNDSTSDSKSASTERQASTARVEDNAIPPSTPSAASSSVGKVKLLEMDEMERLTSRDSKKRKSLSLAAPVEQSKSIKVEKSPASSLPAKPSFTNVPSGIGELEPDQKVAGGEGAQEHFVDQASGSLNEPLPYRPKHRVSAPDSIRRPLSQQDLIALHQTIEARGANTLRQKWVEQDRAQGRDGADGFGLVLQTWGKKSGLSDAKSAAIEAPSTLIHSESEVARHYNSRQELGLQARNFSPILPLKNFNNWVKSVLIGSFGRRGGKAMDMGGGKGGDLQKWDKLGVRELVLADIAATSVDQAKARYLERRFRWKASFFALDCFGESLATTLPPEVLDPPFDTVSLQFCMHYGWSTLQRARLVIENVSRYLDKGGVFIGTIPNAEELYSRRDRLGPDELGFGNGKYRVTFEQKEKRKPFGDRYTFFLDDAVDEVPEYVVDWDQFESLAKECGLSLIFKKPMAEVWEEFRHQHEFENLARRMKVSSNPRRDVQPMDDDLWEATTIYLAFAFEKIR